jgi:hypothetical protein
MLAVAVLVAVVPAWTQLGKAPQAESEIVSADTVADVENAATSMLPAATEETVALPEVPVVVVDEP